MLRSTAKRYLWGACDQPSVGLLWPLDVRSTGRLWRLSVSFSSNNGIRGGAAMQV